MLKEFSLRQDEYNKIKRWFQDEYFDLFTWQDESNQITCFQLCYDRLGDERVISWDLERGFGHHRVDDGEASPHKNMTPVFVRDGVFSSNEVIPRFNQSSRLICQDISNFILEKLNEYAQQNSHK